MKKSTLFLIALLALGFNVKAQQFVSTEPANRNVVLEEFTGRLCGYCPDGHIIANQIKANNPDRFWSVNIHSAGSSNFSTDSYPNLNTAKGNQIRAAFNCNSFPGGVVNRSTAGSQGRNVWANLSNQQFNQAAECNVGGIVRINPDTRVATITVEVYYTGNSIADENYLTVVMLQDSIMGSQSSGSTNPAQWINGQYCHMHILRDIITNTMGDAISPTTQGTLITKDYEYQIPESIGNPNGVEVKLEHISFLAWVSEKYQGTPTRPILNASELEKTIVTNEPIYPMISLVSQTVEASCSFEKNFVFRLTNIGTDTLTSVKYNVQIADVNQEFEWKGILPSAMHTDVAFAMEVPFGTYTGTFTINEANGLSFEASKSFDAECQEWVVSEIAGDQTNIKVYIIQDQFGEQTTWEIINSAGEIVAQGGPYNHLTGTGTAPQMSNVQGLPTNECYLFRIFDSGNNGICCNYGNGSYYLKDANGVKFIQGDGDFGSEASHMFSLVNSTLGVAPVEQGNLNIYPNPAKDYLMVEGEMTSVEVYNAIGQCLLTKTVEGNSTQISLSDFCNGIYFLRVNNNGETAVRKFSVNR